MNLCAEIGIFGESRRAHDGSLCSAGKSQQRHANILCFDVVIQDGRFTIYPDRIPHKPQDEINQMRPLIGK